VIPFTLDGVDVTAAPGETIWQVAKRVGTELPHLCLKPTPGYLPDGNCRVCMVEIAGERTLAPSCRRLPTPGMDVTTASARATTARRLVLDLLLADQPARASAPDPDAAIWRTADAMGVTQSRFPPTRPPPPPDQSHGAITVSLDACIACGLCVQACRSVQVNDVIGMAHRGTATVPVFDLDQPLGQSTCVACGECVQACPTGALREATLVGRSTAGAATVDTLCPYCGVGCQTTVTVEGGTILKVDGRAGPANGERLCVKGRFGFDYIDHRHRLTQPLIRRAGVAKDPACQIDPADPGATFRPASWAEALDVAARGLSAVRDRLGSQALAGFGSAKASNEEAYLFQKLVRVGFGTNNVDHCTRLCHASSVAALIEGIGSGAVTAPFTAVADSDCIFVIGARPTENHPVAATYLKQAVKRGATLIVADPRGHALMDHATHALSFRPGTDVALLNAMLHTIVTEDLIDRAAIATHVDGFEAFARNLEDFSADAMAAMTGVAAEAIRAAARAYATAKASILFWGMGISQSTHGTDNARCLIALALITGQIGRPGTGLHPLRGQNNVQGASDAGLIPMVLPDYAAVEVPEHRQRFEAAWGHTLDPVRGLTVVEILNAAAAGTIQAMYILGENPAMSDPDQTHARAALAALKHLVVQDIFLTETAMLADVVLPAGAHAEKLGSYTNTNRQVQIGRPIRPPPGEARVDWQIIQDLANRLGLAWSYSDAGAIYEEMRATMPSLDGLPWSRLLAEGAVTYPAADADSPGQEILFGDHFPTANGRATLVPVRLSTPEELPDAGYPLILTTGRLLEHWHTGAMTRRARVLDHLEPAALVAIHPRLAARLGLSAGDLASVASRRGAIRAAVRLDPEVPDGVVFIPFAFAEAAANQLTNPALDPIGKIPGFKLCAVRLIRADAAVPEASMLVAAHSD
jgi:formate dehydrogenase major subunit